jgi:sulfoxide reductase heme-binding subunit YedZ
MTGTLVQSKALWYALRASGLVSLLLLTGTMALGIATTNRWRRGALPRAFAVLVHRSVSLLSVAFLTLHVTTAILDPYAHVGLLDTIVPGLAASSPLWLGLGAAGLDLIAALVVTSILRGHLPRWLWRAVHWLAYASWPVAFVHGVGMGTDARTPWVLGIDAVCVGAIAWSIAWRLRERRDGAALPKHLEVPTGRPLKASR